MKKYRFASIITICILENLLTGCSPSFTQSMHMDLIKQFDTNFMHLLGIHTSDKTVAQAKESSSTNTKHKENDLSILPGMIQPNFDPTKTKVVTNSESTLVLVNKYNALPSNYIPPDLVTPSIPWLYRDPSIDVMRKEAATALEQLVAGAKKDNIYIDGVSAYRSYATQKQVYDQYVAQQGVQAANTFSAIPGTSEHQTGLAIDVSDSSGQYAVQQQFAELPAAKWLEQHAYQYGFIVRYPKGKESITGYEYEPWHIRYVGKEVAAILQKNNWTFEEYYQHIYPSSKTDNK